MKKPTHHHPGPLMTEPTDRELVWKVLSGLQAAKDAFMKLEARTPLNTEKVDTVEFAIAPHPEEPDEARRYREMAKTPYSGVYTR